MDEPTKPEMRRDASKEEISIHTAHTQQLTRFVPTKTRFVPTKMCRPYKKLTKCRTPCNADEPVKPVMQSDVLKEGISTNTTQNTINAHQLTNAKLVATQILKSEK